jgi:hypothetical protein
MLNFRWKIFFHEQWTSMQEMLEINNLQKLGRANKSKFYSLNIINKDNILFKNSII